MNILCNSAKKTQQQTAVPALCYIRNMNKAELHSFIIENTKFTFARSSGSGGQNVNKVNTKVHAVLNLDHIAGLTEMEAVQVKSKLHNDINSEGELCVDVQEERNQLLNRETAVTRIEQKITAAAHINKKRRKTKPTRASKERRLKSKKVRSLIKQSRSGSW